jgi:hypothetical protein
MVNTSIWECSQEANQPFNHLQASQKSRDTSSKKWCALSFPLTYEHVIMDPVFATSKARGAPALSTRLHHNNSSRGIGIIDPAFTTAMARGPLTSSTRLPHSSSSRGSSIIGPAFTTTMARGAPTSSTPSPLHQWLEKLRHYLQRHRSPPPIVSSTSP